MRDSAGESFRMKPAAPARRAPDSRSSSSKVVRTSTGGGSRRPRTIDVAAMPSTLRIRRSITTMSGRCSTTAARTSEPSAHSPTMSNPSRGRKMRRSRVRMSSWSSTSSTRIGSAGTSVGPVSVITGPRPVEPRPACRCRPVRGGSAARPARSRSRRRGRSRVTRRGVPPAGSCRRCPTPPGGAGGGR